jgi:polysaccharide deacetylase 2 family uncharacterized protein YibQ
MPQTAIIKINKVIDVIKDNQAILLPLLRRVAIGCLIGFIFVFLISSIQTDAPESQGNTKQKFAISNLFTPSPEVIPTSPSAFKHFDGNKISLNSEQKNAIDNDEPRFTLVINNFGNNTAIMDSFGEQFEHPVTLGLQSTLSPYNPTASSLNELGYEVWLNIQSITSDMSSDNGKSALNPVRDFDYNIALLENQLSNKATTAGIILDNASLLTQSTDLWSKIANDIFAQGYGIFDTTSNAVPTSVNYFDDAYAPYIKKNIMIDTDASIETLTTQLSAIEKSIRSNKNAIITTSIYTPVALDIIARWVNSLTSDGVVMIPLSAQTNL